MSKLLAACAMLGMVVLGLPATVAAQTDNPVQWQPPSVHLDTYTGKPTQRFSFAGVGFVPGEQVDVYLGAQATAPLTSVTADGRGDITGRDMVIPSVSPGDYTLSFVGLGSNKPVSVGFNVQGFHPWTILDHFYVTPHTGVGFEGTDFVPGEVVQVFLNTRLSQPVAQVTADADGRFRTTNAFTLPDLTGNNELIFVGQQSQTEVTATFAAATPPPANP
jgi:hypothetical protein